MEKSLVKCSKLSVDLDYNDPIDVKNGGPKCIGYDFYVLDGRTNQMKNVIINSLKEIGLRVNNIVITSNIYKDINCIWIFEDDIRNEIINSSDYIYGIYIYKNNTRKRS